ncbi:MAG: AAA family ATPase [Prevotella sp.]|nr:AAA family ATPase [Prevotella sp.]
MLGYVCQYNYEHHYDFTQQVKEILDLAAQSTASDGMLSTKSLFKLSTGATKLRPYFKQFESNGVFSKIIRKILLPNSAYKISLFKNNNNEYAAFWLIGFNNMSDFEADSNIEYLASSDSIEQSCHQIIYYGAPGTGKSHKIKIMLEGVLSGNIFRTTFHPDSDYSTFVGAYKPTMKKHYRYDGKVKAKYYEDDDLAGAKKDETIIDKVIEYDFVPQTFIKAYMRAYQTEENVYLVIEEINRGNCAQIFGDLFQLLDRDENGVSEYKIKADADIVNYLEEKLGKDSAGIKDGELCLPSNLYIYATMNTSDQSLFPIDSAFKRRWDWEYEPIKYKNTGWAVEISGNKYSWTSFQKKVNEKIFGDTNSEDKMLGDYFVKANNGNVISEKLFVNKVLFYLWNDVCKDGDNDIFKTDDNKDVKFSDLYGDMGTEMLIGMMEHLGVEHLSNDNIDDEDENDDENGDIESNIKFSINGEKRDKEGKKWRKGALVKRAVEIYCENHQQYTAEQIRDAWMSLNFRIPHIIETDKDREQRITNSNDSRADKRSKEIKLSNGESIHVSTQVGDSEQRRGFTDFLEKIKSKPEWGINIQEL